MPEDWTHTDPQTRTDSGDFESDVDSIEGDSIYEYRARATADGEEFTGETKTFGTPLDAYLLVFIAEPGADAQRYTFAADGPIVPADPDYYNHDESVAGGDWDTVTRPDGDGEWSAEGVTSDGRGDAFWVDGRITSIETDDQLQTELNHQARTLDEILAMPEPEPEPEPEPDPEPDPDPPETDDSLLVLISEPDAGAQRYTVTVDGPIDPADPDGYGTDVAGGDWDTITPGTGSDDWTVEGVTSDGRGDAFWLAGEITSIEADDQLRAELDGFELDLGNDDDGGGGASPDPDPDPEPEPDPDPDPRPDPDYEIVKARGQTITLGDGDVWENKIVDLTTGRGFLLYVNGAATIRNVGFRGLYRGANFLASIAAPRGTVTFEHIYAGDGGTKEGTDFVHGAGGFFYHKKANADVVFRECNVQGFPNNGFYCSNSATGGDITWERCYGKNNGVSTFRAAGGGDRIIDCVAHNDNTDYGDGYSTDWIESSGRPVWVWPGGTVDIENSHFAAGNYPYSLVMRAGGSATMHGGALEGNVLRRNLLSERNVGRDADLSLPAGVPTSPEAAATGGGEGGDAPAPKPDPKPEPPEIDPGEPTKDEIIERLKLHIKQLEEQAADYEEAFDDLEEAIDHAEGQTQFFGGLWDAIRKHIPSRDGDVEEPDDGDDDEDDGDDAPETEPDPETKPDPDPEPDEPEPENPPTIALDYEQAYDVDGTHNGLDAVYDQVHDNRTGNPTDARLTNTMGDRITHLQRTPPGASSSNSKSSNTTVDLTKRVGEHPQEVYHEVDVRLGPDYRIEGNDTDRWLWFLCRDGPNSYDSTSGRGFSNAIGTTVTRGRDAPEGKLNLFHYTYDGRGGGNFQPLDAYVPRDEWFTLGVYCRCNDPGTSNAVYKTYIDGELVDEKSGFQTSRNKNSFVGEVGMLGYYIDYDSGARKYPKNRYFADHKIWVDGDIPAEIRE